MDNIEVICLGAAIVDIPLQPVSKNIFDVDSYPLERIAMTTGGDAINEATIISRLGHRTALISRIGNDAAGHFILEHCRRENIDIHSLKQDSEIDTSINVGLVTADGERTFVTNRNGSLWKLNINDVDFDRFSQATLRRERGADEAGDTEAQQHQRQAVNVKACQRHIHRANIGKEGELAGEGHKNGTHPGHHAGAL